MRLTKNRIKKFLTVQEQLTNAAEQFYINKTGYVPNFTTIIEYEDYCCKVEYQFDFRSPGVCSGSTYEYETILYKDLILCDLQKEMPVGS